MRFQFLAPWRATARLRTSSCTPEPRLVGVQHSSLTESIRTWFQRQSIQCTGDAAHTSSSVQPPREDFRTATPVRLHRQQQAQSKTRDLKFKSKRLDTSSTHPSTGGRLLCSLSSAARLGCRFEELPLWLLFFPFFCIVWQWLISGHGDLFLVFKVEQDSGGTTAGLFSLQGAGGSFQGCAYNNITTSSKI